MVASYLTEPAFLKLYFKVINERKENLGTFRYLNPKLNKWHLKIRVMAVFVRKKKSPSPSFGILEPELDNGQERFPA